MSFFRDLGEATERVRDLVLTDSDVDLPGHEIRSRLAQDYDRTQTGRFPSERELVLLVMGDDEGRVPEDLAELFPNLHRYLDEELT